MNNYLKKALYITTLFSTQHCFAQGIEGIWQNIDDKTQAPKALIEIKKDASGEYTGTILKITPTTGYKPQQFCTKCTGDLQNKPIVGLQVFSKVIEMKPNEYGKGQILDPLSGKSYQVKMKLSPNGNRLQLNGYVGLQLIGRTQTWLRQK